MTYTEHSFDSGKAITDKKLDIVQVEVVPSVVENKPALLQRQSL